MDLKTAIAKIAVTDEFSGTTARYIGLLDAKLGLRIYPFEVEIFETSGGEYEVILRQEESLPSDRDLFFVNSINSNAICYQLEKMLSKALGLQISLTWGAHMRQTSDRFVLSMKEGV